MIDRYIEDDAGFLGWIAAHPNGFVINTDRDAYRRRSASANRTSSASIVLSARVGVISATTGR
ncbi:MAG TPA: hypothetical protein VMM13_01575, partial [Euzebya sp.]|nr:hypothetical protein [Euzebya sp.]